MLDLRLLGRALSGQTNLRVAHVEAVQKRLPMNERGVIEIERDFAHDGEGVIAIFVIIQANFLRDESAERIEREVRDVRFDAVLVQFFGDECARSRAEASRRQIPAAADDRGDRENNGETNRATQKAVT